MAGEKYGGTEEPALGQSLSPVCRAQLVGQGQVRVVPEVLTLSALGAAGWGWGFGRSATSFHCGVLYSVIFSVLRDVEKEGKHCL